MFLSLEGNRVAVKQMETASKLTLYVLLLSCLVHSGLCHNETLTKYVGIERDIISDLEQYIESQESVLHLLRKKLLNFKVEHSEAVDNPEAYFANELNKFLLVKRLASDIHLLSDKTSDVAQKFRSKVDSYRSENIFPSENDLMTSALSIARLQKAQSLRTDKMAKGIFGDVKRR